MQSIGDISCKRLNSMMKQYVGGQIAVWDIGIHLTKGMIKSATATREYYKDEDENPEGIKSTKIHIELEWCASRGENKNDAWAINRVKKISKEVDGCFFMDNGKKLIFTSIHPARDLIVFLKQDYVYFLLNRDTGC